MGSAQAFENGQPRPPRRMRLALEEGSPLKQLKDLAKQASSRKRLP